jgi:hypothetical protein
MIRQIQKDVAQLENQMQNRIRRIGERNRNISPSGNRASRQKCRSIVDVIFAQRKCSKRAPLVELAANKGGDMGALRSPRRRQ